MVAACAAARFLADLDKQLLGCALHMAASNVKMLTTVHVAG